jgi:DNA topoisomerase-6 subunit B
LTESFEEISAADFFYRNRDIAGFTNPSRAIFSSIRELVENSLDAAERLAIPKIKINSLDNRTVIANFKEMSEALKQDPQLFLEYLFKETSTNAKLDGSKAIFEKEVKNENMERLVYRYAENLVSCPDIYIRLSHADEDKFENEIEGEQEAEKTEEETETFETGVYKLRIEDNGSGVSARHVPAAFGQVLYGSKYKLRQTRGTFGLGGTMALLYGQITTHKPASIVSSTGGAKLFMFKLMTDIQRNRPVVLDRKILLNKESWRGTVVDFSLEGDYSKAMPRILEYLKQTALVNPFANVTFIDPKGRLYRFTRVTKKMPPPPTETKPHPYGVDVETIQRLIRITPCRNMIDFMKYHFHRVGETTALRFLRYGGFVESKNPANWKTEDVTMLMQSLKQLDNDSKKIRIETIEELVKKIDDKNIIGSVKTHLQIKDEGTALRVLLLAGLIRTKDPRKLSSEEIVRLVHAMKRFNGFLAPDASCLSPLGEELLRAGILKELQPEFIAIRQRPPSTYEGHPFIVETAIAYGGNIPKRNDFVLYRFANRIPLLYDEASDVSWRIIKEMNWRRYKVSPDMPIAILVHLCSTKVPYKTVGKEFIADRPEVKREILNGIREAARELQHFLTKREYVEHERKRLGIFSKYLPKIAKFSTDLAEKKNPPDITQLLNRVKKYEETD